MANSRKNPQAELMQLLEDVLLRHLPGKRPLRLCVGLSGGLDSVVLLHLLHKTRLAPGLVVSALHVHHGLSAQADEWAQFTARLCEEWSIPFSVRHVAVKPQGDGLEAAARAARYGAFEQSDADVLLLAHHANDQAETVLFNLLRGSGVSGLSGMPVQRMLGEKLIVRPLLGVGRAELLAYAQAHGLHWVEDESNASLAFSRNHLRHAVLPQLARRYPSVVSTLARTAGHLAEADQLLEELALIDVADCVCQGAFDLERARSLPAVRMRHALRYWLKRSGIVLESRSWHALLAMLDARDDGMPVLVWRKQAIRRYRNRLHITPASCQPGLSCEWLRPELGEYAPEGWQGRLELTAGAMLAVRFMAGPWSLRPWLGSAGLRLHPGRHRRSLKHLCQEAGIAPWVRESTPLIYWGEQLMAMPGLGVDAAFQPEPQEPGVNLCWFASAGRATPV